MTILSIYLRNYVNWNKINEIRDRYDHMILISTIPDGYVDFHIYIDSINNIRYRYAG